MSYPFTGQPLPSGSTQRQEFRGRVVVGRTLLRPEETIATDNSGVMGTLVLDGDTADIRVGGNSSLSGDIRLFAAANPLEPTIHLDGGAGDIRILGGDCAEALEIADAQADNGPGSVMVLDQDGKLCLSHCAYDTKVAGIVSGANRLPAGIVLGNRKHAATSLPIALIGKVYCKVDARQSSVAVGDLLTTSDTPGHAMKVLNRRRAFGAVLGKALAPLQGTAGLIPVLVALQ